MARQRSRSVNSMNGLGQAGGYVFAGVPQISLWTGRHESNRKRPAAQDRRHQEASICATRPLREAKIESLIW